MGTAGSRSRGLGRVAIEADQAPEGLRAGPLDAGMRPETLNVVFEGQEASGRTEGVRVAEGRIEERAYYGDMTYYDVALPGAPRPVTVSMKNIMGREVLERGDPVRLAWDLPARSSSSRPIARARPFSADLEPGNLRAALRRACKAVRGRRAVPLQLVPT